MKIVKIDQSIFCMASHRAANSNLVLNNFKLKMPMSTYFLHRRW